MKNLQICRKTYSNLNISFCKSIKHKEEGFITDELRLLRNGLLTFLFVLLNPILLQQHLSYLLPPKFVLCFFLGGGGEGYLIIQVKQSLSCTAVILNTDRVIEKSSAHCYKAPSVE